MVKKNPNFDRKSVNNRKTVISKNKMYCAAINHIMSHKMCKSIFRFKV